MREPTTDAMVQAAQDAYDVAAADAAVAEARYVEAMRATRKASWSSRLLDEPTVIDEVVTAAARCAVSRAARGYALSVLHGARLDAAVDRGVSA